MNKEKLTGHNAFQRHYYETALDKPAMQVRDTPYVRRHLERMIQHGNLRTGKNILEVGAGLGKFSIPLLRQGYRLTCNDLSPIQLGLLQVNSLCPVNTIACDIIDIGRHTEETFDHVIGFFTLHHMLDLRAAFSGMKQVMRPGADIAFIEPVGRNPLYYLQIAVTPGMTMRAERGILNMSDRVVHQAMHTAGLEPLPSVTFGFAPPVLINLPWGSRMEDFFNQQTWLNWAHAFVMFKARNPI